MALTNNDIISRYKKEKCLDDNTILNTFGNWKKQGFTVNKGEKCKHKIKLFSENKQNNTIIKKTCYLFDETQVTKI